MDFSFSDASMNHTCIRICYQTYDAFARWMGCSYYPISHNFICYARTNLSGLFAIRLSDLAFASSLSYIVVILRRNPCHWQWFSDLLSSYTMPEWVGRMDVYLHMASRKFPNHRLWIRIHKKYLYAPPIPTKMYEYIYIACGMGNYEAFMQKGPK